MGSLVKHYFSKFQNRQPNEVYHVTVMPCYDKKLEASREDFYNDVYSTRDVDCVITTGQSLKNWNNVFGLSILKYCLSQVWVYLRFIFHFVKLSNF